VNFELTPEQQLLQSTARDWFAKRFAPSDMRHLLEGHPSHKDSRELASAGYLGTLIDVDRQGEGLTLLELALICEQAGRMLADVPLVATAAYSVGVLAEADGAASELLARIATNGTTVAVARADDARLDRSNSTVTARASAVIGAEVAEVLVIAHDAPTDPWVAVVSADGDGVSRASGRAVDPTRRLADVACNDAPALVVSQGDAARRSIETGRRRAYVALASEDLGAAAACLERSIAYAKDRRAFGRAIGSFQVIKHMCVDAYIAVEQLRTLVWYSGWCERGEPESFPLVASAARVYAAETLDRCAETQIQVHGGIGATWEHDAHLFWRRAQVDKAILGDEMDHRELVARAALELQTTRTDRTPAPG
jgi:alkylation response protein AidB-like acyl-CoA dehydrogenase